jgi:hypothetical protein
VLDGHCTVLLQYFTTQQDGNIKCRCSSSHCITCIGVLEAVGATGAVEVLSFSGEHPVVFLSVIFYLILILEVQCELVVNVFSWRCVTLDNF